MSVQTPQKVAVLSKVLNYFELAAAIGMEIPNAHVQQISALVEELSEDLQGAPAWRQQDIPSAVTFAVSAAIPAASEAVVASGEPVSDPQSFVPAQPNVPSGPQS